MTTKTKLAAGAGALAVVIAIAAIFVVVTGKDDDTSTGAAPAAPSSTAAQPMENTGDNGFGNPTADMLGRKVMHPNNPAGQALAQTAPGPRTECDPGAPVTSPTGVMIQTTFDTPNLFSTSDGPTKVDGLIARGYSHSPQGASLAAYNIWQRFQLGGDVAAAVLENQAVADPEVMKRFEAEGMAETRASAETRKVTPAPSAFRVLSCDPDFVVTEYATRYFGDENGPFPTERWATFRFNMVWQDGDWKMQFLKGAASASVIDDLTGWTAWAF
ncbi:hypothetical protein ABIC73_004347 [Prescottella equi]|uniref:hypothetical protein n=1 Tax=Rhodococcus hoagii TaxID=43767 RepID=UPI00339817B5